MMRVLIDTNILISAALSNKGTPFAAFKKAVTYPNHGLICEQNIDEMRRIFNRKFPKRIDALEKFLSLALMTLEMVPTPMEEFKTYFRDVCHPGCQKFYSQNEAISEKFQAGFSKNFTAKIRGYLKKI